MVPLVVVVGGALQMMRITDFRLCCLGAMSLEMAQEARVGFGVSPACRALIGGLVAEVLATLFRQQE